MRGGGQTEFEPYPVTSPVEPLVTKLTKRTTNLGSFFIGNAFAMAANPNVALFRHSEKPENQAENLRRFSDYSESHSRETTAMRLRLVGRNDGGSCEKARLLPRPTGEGWGEGANKAAFTLSEVLITLGIIGVVASLTLPTLIQKHQDKELIVATKKVYSDIQNATLLAQNSLGTPGDNLTLFDGNKTKEEVMSEFVKYFKGARLCKTYNECKVSFYKIKMATNYQNNDGSYGRYLTYPLIMLNNGAIISLYNLNKDCIVTEERYERDEAGNLILDDSGNGIATERTYSLCGLIHFDVNGPKNPNQYGRDVYRVKIEKTRLFPDYSGFIGGQSFENILTGKDELIYDKNVKY